MPSLETFALFATASLVLVLVPGPAVVYILTRSVSQGRTAGLVSVVGVNLGSSIHVLAAVAGLSLILAQSAFAFGIIKWAGVAYLGWIGIRTLRSPDMDFSEPQEEADGLKRIFIQGVLVNVLNPKVAVFFLAFLPQFIDPHASNPALQTFVLGMTLVTIGLITDSAYALLGGKVGTIFRRRPGAARTARIASGWTYLALAGVAAATGNRN
jgi:threonine/homoserine/homoserine lactone efflux protein